MLVACALNVARALLMMYVALFGDQNFQITVSSEVYTRGGAY
jgi:hypothetical protein